MKEAICWVQDSFTPLVVMAGMPILSQEGWNGGLGSSGMVDLEVEIQIFSKVCSATAPLRGVPEKSMTII